jgi:hypothetical protein
VQGLIALVDEAIEVRIFVPPGFRLNFLKPKLDNIKGIHGYELEFMCWKTILAIVHLTNIPDNVVQHLNCTGVPTYGLWCTYKLNYSPKAWKIHPKSVENPPQKQPTPYPPLGRGLKKHDDSRG